MAEEATKWYVLRITYGMGMKANIDMADSSISTYYPTRRVVRMKNGKRVKLKEPYIPNLIFARSTKDTLENFMLGTSKRAKYVHFYRNRLEGKTDNFKNPPLTISEEAMRSFRIICDSPKDDIRFARTSDVDFTANQWVQVTDGEFKGVVGRVTHWKNQKRIGVDLDGLFTVFTTYIPKAFLKPVTPP